MSRVATGRLIHQLANSDFVKFRNNLDDHTVVAGLNDLAPRKALRWQSVCGVVFQTSILEAVHALDLTHISSIQVTRGMRVRALEIYEVL